MIKKLYENDKYMTFDIIKVESRIAAAIFQWTINFLDQMKVSKKLNEIGIKKIELECKAQEEC